MAKFDREKALKKQNKKVRKQLIYGMNHGLVYPYSDWLFDRLRPYSYGGFPASIMLLVDEMNNGRCYDRARLMQLAFDDARVVHADIESLRIICDPADGSSPEHAFVETKAFGGGREWVVDTTEGFIYDKKYYYKVEKPKVNHVFEKEQLMRDRDILDILASDFEKEKYVLPLTVPIIKKVIENSRCLTTHMYRDKIKKELDIFLKAIHYDEIEKEMHEDAKLMWKDPKKLDEKFGIVRDEHGREMSRNGVPNPYYKSLEDIKRDNEYFESIIHNEEKRKQYFAELVKKSEERWRGEYLELSELSKKRIEDILADPKKDFYLNYGYTKQGDEESEEK